MAWQWGPFSSYMAGMLKEEKKSKKFLISQTIFIYLLFMTIQMLRKSDKARSEKSSTTQTVVSKHDVTPFSTASEKQQGKWCGGETVRVVGFEHRRQQWWYGYGEVVMAVTVKRGKCRGWEFWFAISGTYGGGVKSSRDMGHVRVRVVTNRSLRELKRGLMVVGAALARDGSDGGAPIKD